MNKSFSACGIYSIIILAVQTLISWLMLRWMLSDVRPNIHAEAVRLCEVFKVLFHTVYVFTLLPGPCILHIKKKTWVTCFCPRTLLIYSTRFQSDKHPVGVKVSI